MAQTIPVTCPPNVYTQVSTVDTAYCIVSNPISRLKNGQRIRVYIGAAAPVGVQADYNGFHPLNKDEVFERPAELVGHIWVFPETEAVDIAVTENV